MRKKPETIKIFLAEGIPTGVRVLEMLNWNGKGYIIPRANLKYATSSDELDTQAVYFLIGEENEEPVLYIGESEEFAKRIKYHDHNKKFWHTAICFFSQDNSLNKAHVKYLESRFTDIAKNAGRIKIKSGKNSTPAKLTESDHYFAEAFADNTKTLLSALGYTFLKKPIEQEEDTEIFYCTTRGANAEGVYTSEGFTVKKGSLCSPEEMVKSAASGLVKKRALMIDKGDIVDSKNGLVFSNDYLFSSPSTAAGIVSGRNCNGWVEWKNSEGKKLKDIIDR